MKFIIQNNWERERDVVPMYALLHLKLNDLNRWNLHINMQTHVCVFHDALGL